MSKHITVHFKDGTKEEKAFPDKLYDLSWNNYQMIERKMKMNAELDRDGEIQNLSVSEENMGDFIVEIQETLAKAILREKGVKLDEVTVKTVKTIIEEYGDDMNELGLKLKKKKAN